MIENILLGIVEGIIAAIGLMIIVVASIALDGLKRKRGWGLSREQWVAFGVMLIGYALLFGGLWLVFMA